MDTIQFHEEQAGAAHHVAVCGARDRGRCAELFCIEDDYTDGWRTPDTVLLLHGIAERAETWRAWVPQLARRYRVLRPDLRGFGRSSALPAGFTIADWADDIVQMIATLERTRVHLVATKLGALIAFELAQRQPQWVASMTLAGMLPSPNKALGPWIDDWLAMVEGESGSEGKGKLNGRLKRSGTDGGEDGAGGVERWARETMPGRMGSALSPAAMQWWTRAMATAPAASVAACFRLLPGIDGPSCPERVQCPTLFIAAGAPIVADRSSYDQRPAAADLQRLRERVAGSSWVEVPADSYHIAATHPDDCAREALAFIERVDEAQAAAIEEAGGAASIAMNGAAARPAIETNRPAP
ncbi:alpha/beta hydrolase [Paraburkholderia sp. SARCC-3016]|uniref:alpha/beta fold hydrolase n=1 Tax=Paraburkholderia sp. SARCC-3016 TaxID=3058611 RepID=UPI0028081265|nr:alpha/beta hydrolase [Paraburkholderia sp. SARCC-3016]MDQ7975978.1 alpha/beta hydrolase [Paraburkholderia sp. SARCC-3016]